MKYKITGILISIIFLGCSEMMADMKLRKQEIQQFKMEITNSTLTEEKLSYYNQRDCITAWKLTQTTIIYAGQNVQVSQWRIDNYPNMNLNTYIIFHNGKLFSKTTRMKPQMRRMLR